MVAAQSRAAALSSQGGGKFWTLRTTMSSICSKTPRNGKCDPSLEKEWQSSGQWTGMPRRQGWCQRALCSGSRQGDPGPIPGAAESCVVWPSPEA